MSEHRAETWYYETVIPRKFILDDGSIVELKADEVRKRICREPLFLLYVPPTQVDNVYRALLSHGFREESLLRVYKGEKYSLVKKLVDPWELHVRIYENGMIESEVEVSRDYVEHLGDSRIYVVYETFNYYSQVYNKLHILYKQPDRWVIKVIDHFHIKIRPPKTLTPWKPIVITAAILTTIGLLTYALSRLEKGESK